MNRRKWRRNNKKVKLAGFECENCGYRWNRKYDNTRVNSTCPICGESRKIAIILRKRGNL